MRDCGLTIYSSSRDGVLKHRSDCARGSRQEIEEIEIEETTKDSAARGLVSLVIDSQTGRARTVLMRM